MRRTTHEKNCLCCGNRYTAYRSDTKYCSDECRSHAHYKKTEGSRATAKERELITKRTNDKLWANREILFEYQGREVTLAELEARGFNLEYITRVKKKQSIIFYEIYDMLISKLENGSFRIRKYLS